MSTFALSRRLSLISICLRLYKLSRVFLGVHPSASVFLRALRWNLLKKRVFVSLSFFIPNSFTYCSSLESSRSSNDSDDCRKKEELSRVFRENPNCPDCSLDIVSATVIVENINSQITDREKVDNYLKHNDFNNTITTMTTHQYQYGEFYPGSPLSPTKSDNVFDSSSTDMSKEYYRPYVHQRDLSASSDEVIPTRNLVRNTSTSQATKEALKFVSSTSHLHETAKEVIDKMKDQHLSREQLQKEVLFNDIC